MKIPKTLLAMAAAVAIIPMAAQAAEFRSADTTMRDRFGMAPTISFADGLTRLSAFLGRS